MSSEMDLVLILLPLTKYLFMSPLLTRLTLLLIYIFVSGMLVGLFNRLMFRSGTSQYLSEDTLYFNCYLGFIWPPCHGALCIG